MLPSVDCDRKRFRSGVGQFGKNWFSFRVKKKAEANGKFLIIIVMSGKEEQPVRRSNRLAEASAKKRRVAGI